MVIQRFLSNSPPGVMKRRSLRDGRGRGKRSRRAKSEKSMKASPPPCAPAKQRVDQQSSPATLKVQRVASDRITNSKSHRLKLVEPLANETSERHRDFPVPGYSPPGLQKRNTASFIRRSQVAATQYREFIDHVSKVERHKERNPKIMEKVAVFVVAFLFALFLLVSFLPRQEAGDRMSSNFWKSLTGKFEESLAHR